MPSLFSALQAVLKRWFGAPSQQPMSADAPASEISANDLQNTSMQAEEYTQHHSQIVPYDEDLLERSRTQWQFGDWERLAQISRDTLQHHPDRAKLALLAAAGLLQQGESDTARQYIRLAQDWGCSKKLVSQILIAGVHNSLGRAAVVGGQEQRALAHFEYAITTGMPGADLRLVSRARINMLSPMPLFPNFIEDSKLGAPSDYTQQKLLHEGYEACTYRVGDQVVKVYKSTYFDYNKAYNRLGEGRFLKLYKSSFFIPLFQETPFFIVMPYAGEKIGDIYQLHHERFNNKKLCTWLTELRQELKRLAIKHRDINPTNILYDSNRDKFTLIDFGWAIRTADADDVTCKPQGMNPYGPADEVAIEKMIAASSKFLNTTAGH